MLLRVRTGPKALRAVGGRFFKLWESKEKLTGPNTLPALLWSFSVPLFCALPAVCSGRLTFSLSCAIPQFKLESHKSSLRLLSGPSGWSLP